MFSKNWWIGKFTMTKFKKYKSLEESGIACSDKPRWKSDKKETGKMKDDRVCCKWGLEWRRNSCWIYSSLSKFGSRKAAMCNQNSEVFRELCEIDHDMPFVKQMPFWFSIGSSCFFMFILLDMWDQQNSNSKHKTHKTCDPSSQPSTSKMQRPSVSLCGPVKRQPTSSPDVSAQIPDRYYLFVDLSGIQTFPKIWVHPYPPQ